MNLKKTILASFLLLGISITCPVLQTFAATTQPAIDQPLLFVENKGQMDADIKFFEKGSSHTTYFSKDGISFNLFKSAPPESNSNKGKFLRNNLTLSFTGGNNNPLIEAKDKQKTKFNYYLGNDPAKWQTGVASYGKVAYREIYKNIDLEIYGNNQQLEYDVIVKPGGDPADIVFRYQGINSMLINDNGGLDIILTHGILTQKAPYLYQEIDGRRVEVSGSFKLLADNSYTFNIDSYNPDKRLVIDPIIEYSGYVAGNGIDMGNAIAVDGSDNTYMTGYTESNYLAGKARNNVTYKYDAFVYKADPTGTKVFVTFFGGTAIDWITGATREAGNDIAVDGNGYIHITGSTFSIDFPTTSGAYQTTLAGHQIQTHTDAFYTVLSTYGTITYSTYLGGSNIDMGNALALDNAGNTYIAGSTAPYRYNIPSNFPTLNALQSSYGGDPTYDEIYPADGFIAKFHFDAAVPANTSLLYSTYFGDNNSDAINGIAVDSSGGIYITGSTRSKNLPGVSASSMQPNIGGGTDVFITKINSAGDTILYSTYLGGIKTDYGMAIDVDLTGNAYVTGYISYPGTKDIADFPLLYPIQTSTAGNSVVFVTKLNATGSSMVYSTIIGGAGDDQARDIAVDSNGTAYITGFTDSTDFPVYNAINGHNTLLGLTDGFITRLTPSGRGFLYSTYFGGNSGSDTIAFPGSDTAMGIAVDNNGNAYITGQTTSACLPAPEVGGVPTCIGGSDLYQDSFFANIYDDSAMPPSVTGVSPVNGAVDVAVGTTITATFSKSMDIISFAGNFNLFDGATPIAGTVGSSDGLTITFTPSPPLTMGTLYTATLTTAIQAVDGSFLDPDYTWQFTTIPPVLDLTPPSIIATNITVREQGVAIDTLPTITFSEDMDITTLDTNSFYLRWWDDESYVMHNIAGAVSYDSATQTATFTPDADLPYQTWITIIVERSVTDLAGNPLHVDPPFELPPDIPYNDPFERQFHTSCDPLSPTIVSTSPSPGATDIVTTPTISFTFDQDMDIATVNEFAIELWPTTWIAKIPGTVKYNVATKTISLTPSAPLEANTPYMAVVSSAVLRTTKGRELCLNPGVFFTTSATSDPCSPDTTSPTISAPSNTATNCTGIGGTPVDLGTPTTSDTCDISPGLTNDAPALFPVGTTSVTWTATDASGNSSSATQDITISDPLNLCSPLSLSSPFSIEPPVMDGILAFGEWSAKTSNQINMENGFIRVSNDSTRLYILIDLLADKGDDIDLPRDNFNITFDVNNDGFITPGTDINYSLYPDVANIRYQFYTGADSLSAWQPETFSSMARGFDCFLGDGSKTLNAAFLPDTCSPHRIWEIAIDLQEINALPGDTLAMGIQLISINPGFIEDFPAPFSSAFNSLLEIQLEQTPPTPDDIASGSVYLEMDATTDAIEITQVIQDRMNRLPLVQDKDTVARVYAVADSATGLPTQSLVSLYAQKNGVDLPGSPLTLFHRAPLVIDREILADTANFKLPKSWTQGDVSFYTTIRGVNPGDLGDTSLTIPLTFTKKEIPTFWTIKLNTGTEAVPNLVPDAELLTQKDLLKTIFPLADVNFINQPWESVGVTTRNDSIADLNEYYDLIFMGWIFGAIATGEEPFELPSQIYGMTVEDGGLSDPVRSGGRGIVARGGSNSDTEDGIMAHEMNHNLGPGDCQLRVDDGMLDDIWGSHVSSLDMPEKYDNDPIWNCVVGELTPDNTSPDYGCNARGPDPDWQELFDDGNIAEVGFDTRLPWQENDGTRTTIIPADTPDLMTYCSSSQTPTRWNSAYRWERQFNYFPTIFDTIPMAAVTYAAPDILLIEDVYYISGQIYIDGTASLSPIISTQGTALLPEMSGQYAIDFLDAQGDLLQTYSFYNNFEEEDDGSGYLAQQASFNFRLPVLAAQSVDSINLMEGATILDSINVSANIPQITITSPNGAENWNGLETISWIGVDLDNDPLVFSVLYSPDNGATWTPIARNLQNSPYTVDTAIIAGSINAKIRVIATDGFHTAMDDSDASFSVQQNPPQAAIIEPADNAFFELGTKITLRAQATDLEDGVLADDFVWILNGQAIAVGPKAEVSLPVGPHELILRVTDSDGAYSEVIRSIEGMTILGDYDDDGDVDGLDLARQASGITAVQLKDLAHRYGLGN